MLKQAADVALELKSPSLPGHHSLHLGISQGDTQCSKQAGSCLWKRVEDVAGVEEGDDPVKLGEVSPGAH